MTDGLEDLRALTVDLQKATRVDVDVRKAVQVEARKMKADWRARVSGSSRLRGLAAAVTYDTRDTPAGATAEVGYEQRGQGELGNIAEFGTSTSGPVLPAGEEVLKGGATRLERFVNGVSEKLL